MTPSITASEVLDRLASQKPASLFGLPKSFGIYALWDHEGAIRYIGATPRMTEGFNIRVGNKHVTGTEGRSHKFSHVYCVGRMWRFCRKLHPDSAGQAENLLDAKAAKRLRTLFIRRHCAATYVEIRHNQINENYFSFLTDLERAVYEVAPASMSQWAGVKCPQVSEPATLVEDLLKLHPYLRDPVERQRNIFRQHVAPVLQRYGLQEPLRGTSGSPHEP